jgi:RHS repeat-associated protein
MQFTGKPNIAGIEAYDFNARYYDPELGRFYSIDPLWNPAESPYAYCYNNPVNFTDPTGMTSNPVELEKALKGLLSGKYQGQVVDNYSNNRDVYTLDDAYKYFNLGAFDLAWQIYDALCSQPPMGMDPDNPRGTSVWLRLMNQVRAQEGMGGTPNAGGTTPPSSPPAEENTKAYNEKVGEIKREFTTYRIAIDILYPSNTGLNYVAKLAVLAREMWPNRHNDPKNDDNSQFGRRNIINDNIYTREDIGNRLYGEAGRALGMPNCVLGWGGGGAAFLFNGSKDFNNWEGLFDEKRDTDMLKGR